VSARPLCSCARALCLARSPSAVRDSPLALAADRPIGAARPANSAASISGLSGPPPPPPQAKHPRKLDAWATSAAAGSTANCGGRLRFAGPPVGCAARWPAPLVRIMDLRAQGEWRAVRRGRGRWPGRKHAPMGPRDGEGVFGRGRGRRAGCRELGGGALEMTRSLGAQEVQPPVCGRPLWPHFWPPSPAGWLAGWLLGIGAPHCTAGALRWASNGCEISQFK